MAGKTAKKHIKIPQEIKTTSDFERLCASMDEQHKLFCDHYLVTLNASDSYKKAGYRAKGNSAEASAIRLLRNVKVKSYIDWKIRQRKKHLLVDERYVLGMLQAITKVKITDYFDIVERKIGSGKLTKTLRTLTIKDLNKMPDAAVQLIDSITEGQYGITIKLISKSTAIEKLGAHLGMWNKDQKNSGSGEGTKYIIRRYIVPAQGNVMIKPTITPADIKDIVTKHIIEQRNR